MANRIQVKRGSKANLPTLYSGEFGWCTDTYELYIGDGTNNHELIVADKFTANSILKADTAGSPTALSVGEGRLVGRKSGGSIAALAGADVWSILSGTAGAAVDMNAQRITNLGTPTADSDAATKTYVDDLVSKGLTFHEAVKDKDTLDPSGLTPSTGDRYWIGGTGEGDWEGHDYEIAQWNGSAWEFEEVTDGDAAFVTDENKYYYYDADTTSLKLLATAMGAHASTHHAGGSDALDVSDLADASNKLLGADRVKDSHIDWGTGGDQVNTDSIPEGSTNKWCSAANVDAAGAVMESDYTAKGVLLVATGAGSPSALSVGSDGQVLTADSSQSAGVKWTDVAQTFIGLTDTPSGYTGCGGNLVRVKSTEDGVEFFSQNNLFEDTPTDGTTNKGPTSDWAYDHENAATGVHGAGSNTLLHSGSVIDGGTF